MARPAVQRWKEAVQELKVREKQLYDAIESRRPDVVSLKAGIEKVEDQLNALWYLADGLTVKDNEALRDSELLEPMDFLDCWTEALYDADGGIFTEAWHVIARIKGQAEADQEEMTTIAAGDDDEVGDDDDAEDPDGSHEGRGARTEQAFSHTAEDAVATVVHGDHLLTADHATLEGSSDMVGVEIQDLGDVVPVLVPPEDYQDLANHSGEGHILEVEKKEEVPDATDTGQLKSRDSLQATCDDGEPVHGVLDGPKLPVLCHHGGEDVVTAIVHDPEKLLEVEEMGVDLSKARKHEASHLGKDEFDMWVSEVVEDIKPMEDLVTPVKLGLVMCLLIAVGYVVVREVMPGLAAAEVVEDIEASYPGMDEFIKWASVEVVEDIEAKPREDLATPVELRMVDDLAKELLTARDHVVESEVTPGLAALGRAGLPGGQQLHGYQGEGDVQVEPGGSCLLYEPELLGVGANYIGAEPAAVSSDFLELHKVELCDHIGGEDVNAKMLEVENCIKAVLGVQLYAEDLMVEVGGIKSVISYQEGSMCNVNYLQDVYYKQDYDYLNTESARTQFIQV